MDQCCTEQKCLEAMSQFNPDINTYLRFQLPDFSGPVLDTCRTRVQSACMPMFTGPEATSTGPSEGCWKTGEMNLMGYPEDALVPQTASVPLRQTNASSISFHAPRYSDDKDGDGHTENVRFDDIDKDGKYIRLFNDSECQDEELGCCVVRQAFKGHSIIEFHFPPRVFFPARNFVTIWARQKQEKQDPDEVIECCCCCCNFYFNELYRWASGPDYLTTLVRPNGQIIATAKSSGFSTSKEENQGPAPRIISKYNFINNRFRQQYEEKKALAGPSSVHELTELLIKSRLTGRFKPRTTRRDGTEAAPKGGQVRQNPSIDTTNMCVRELYPD